MEIRTISSAQTFFAKWIFPAIWITAFGAGTIAMWWHPATNNDKDPKLQFLIGWIVGTLFALLGPARLKRVRIDATNLYVSNYLRESTIPLGEIVDVTENSLLNYHPVRVHFRHPTSFGTTIVFMPKMRLFWWSHPVVAELKELSHLSAKK